MLESVYGRVTTSFYVTNDTDTRFTKLLMENRKLCFENHTPNGQPASRLPDPPSIDCRQTKVSSESSDPALTKAAATEYDSLLERVLGTIVTGSQNSKEKLAIP